jgi:hypothetical protein
VFIALQDVGRKRVLSKYGDELTDFRVTAPRLSSQQYC